MDGCRFTSYMAWHYQPGRFMRLLIYLLAMMTGFSAAEAARPVSTTPAAVAQGAIIAASVVSAQHDVAARPAEKVADLQQVAQILGYTALRVTAKSPVSRRDIIRE